MINIFFWQRIVSPHVAGLAVALARQGCQVTYLAERPLSKNREILGWKTPDLLGVKLIFVDSNSFLHSLVDSAPDNSIHISQGIRGNGFVGEAQVLLAKRGLRLWVVMETVDDSGWKGILKRFTYQYLFQKWRHSLQGILAIGYTTPNWVLKRGLPKELIFPFAYFLTQNKFFSSSLAKKSKVRFLFVGQFIELKKLDLLISALKFIDHFDFELSIIGSGPMESSLRTLAKRILPDRVDWIGKVPMENIPKLMARADCLVLPSMHDGWGAVVSEALMVGTPVICSDKCGAAGVVIASCYGGVFRSGNIESLVNELLRIINDTPFSQEKRMELMRWAQCLGADAGAEYFLKLLSYKENSSELPTPPWGALNDL